ncbi:MAG: hypothetical protein Kow0099_18310 [Candidatus Abyssubacteria bacterium]
MREKYRICLVMPKGYGHSLCFREIAILLKSSIVSAGIDCDFQVNQLAADRINVILGYHLMKFDESLTRCRYIPYQFEQLDAREGWYSEDVKTLLQNAFAVWDYSWENIEFLRRLGIPAKHLPLGYHENLEAVRHNTSKDIDILFYGSMGERRKFVIDALSACANVKVLFGVYGKERDEYIARSKIILNVHFYSARIFEAPRISYLLNNRCFVISEESATNPYEGVELCEVPYDRLAETCIYYLNHPEEIDRKRASTYEQFKNNYPMTMLIEKVL